MAGHLTDESAVVPFLLALERQGFELTVEQDRLRIRPGARVDDALRTALEQHKAALLALLAPVRGHVTLKGGLMVPLPALQLLWCLEDRGFQMSLSADQQFVVVPTDALTDVDQAGIHRWRRHLAALVAYEVPPRELPQ